MNKVAISGLLFLIAIIGVIFYTTQKYSPTNATDPLAVLTQTPTGFAQQQAQQQAANQQAGNQQQQAPQQSQQVVDDSPLKASQAATIKTSKGDIKIILYTDVAPNTSRNFINKAKSSYYTNLTFHRVEDWVVQGGDPAGTGAGGGNMPVEFNDKPFVIGSLGVASRGDGKVQNDSQFFITKKEASWLNGQYTNFGEVTEGMDVVDSMVIGDKILSISLN